MHGSLHFELAAEPHAGMLSHGNALLKAPRSRVATPHAHFAYILPYRARKSSGTYSRFVLCIMPHANFERAAARGSAADDTPLVLAPRAKALESARAAQD